MTQTTVTYTLEEVLKDFKSEISRQFTELNKRFDNLETEFKEFRQETQKHFETLETEVKEFRKETDKQFTSVNVKLATLTEKVDGIDRRVIKLENTLTIQLWALIAAIVTAVVKFGFFPNP